MLHQEVVEHVFAIVAGPIFMDVLRISGAVDEDDGGSALLEVSGLVEACRNLDAVAGGEFHDRHIQPLVLRKVRRRRGGEFGFRRAGLIGHDEQFGWLVGVRVNVGDPLFIARKQRAMTAGSRRDLGGWSSVDWHVIEVPLVG